MHPPLNRFFCPARSSVLAFAATLALGVMPSTATALSIGRLVVESALGEPLRAEINILDINEEEAVSLKAGVASVEAFRAAGIEYSSALSGLQITLQRRSDGRSVLQLTGSRPINEPFIDLIVEASWSSGRLVRDYTLLLDPPNLRVQATAAPATQAPATPVEPRAAQSRLSSPASVTATEAKPPVARTAPVNTQSRQTPTAITPVDVQIKVRPGDTAGRIAQANKPTSVSLDQMLVALLRTNPDAFVKGNIHRLKAGTVLDLPEAAQIEAIPANTARETVLAQSRDFNEYRRKLAGITPTTQVASTGRQASGKIDARAQDAKTTVDSPDKLTLSKGNISSKSAEDTLAKDMARKDATARLAELSKNIKDLNKLGAAAPTASSPVSAASDPKPIAAASTATRTTSPAPAVPASQPAPALPASMATPVAPPASTAAPVTATASMGTGTPVQPTAPATSTTQLPVNVPAPPASIPPVSKKPAPPPPTLPESSFLDDLIDSPAILAAAGSLVALLAGLGIYRQRKGKKAVNQDSSFLESRLQPDSFFGASGGQKIDTNESTNDGSSMMYSPSQLDAAGDVDPVAEADVYLAYGRDLQAEEILKEALRINPSRIALHGKLLEIYAKRRDAKAFESVATEAYSITQGDGGAWEHICEMGRELDPGNSLYQPGGQPEHARSSTTTASSTHSFTATTVTQAGDSLPSTSDSALDLDLDLDFSLDTPVTLAEQTEPTHAIQPVTETPTVALSQAEITAAQAPPSMDLDMSMDFDIQAPSNSESNAVAALDLPDLDLTPSFTEPQASTSDSRAQGLNDDPMAEAPMNVGFDLDEPPSVTPIPVSEPTSFDAGLGLDFDLLPEASTPPEPTPEMVRSNNASTSTADFDVGDLSFDLGDAPPELNADSGLMQPPPEDNVDDPLGTKLALAQEFHAIGDAEGARSLAEEVLAEATGNLKIRAQRFLGELG